MDFNVADILFNPEPYVKMTEAWISDNLRSREFRRRSPDQESSKPEEEGGAVRWI